MTVATNFRESETAPIAAVAAATAPRKGKGIELQVPPAASTVEYIRPMGEVVLDAIGSAERASMLALSLHEHLTDKGLTTLAREVWVIYLEASRSAERMGDAIGVDVVVA